jgi:amidase
VCRSVRDSAAVLDAICGAMPGDPYVAPARQRPYAEELAADPGHLRVGLMATPPGGQFAAHTDCIAAAEAAAGQTIGSDDVEPATWALAELGRSHSAADYLSAVEHHQRITRRVAEWWQGGFDLLLTPTTGEPATALGTFESVPENPVAPIMRSVPLATFTAMFNSTGQPAISLPLHWTGAPRSARPHCPSARAGYFSFL